MTLENGKEAWALSSSQYVQVAVKNVEDHLKSINKTLPRKATSPFRGDYRPEIDLSTELNPKQAAYYQSLIGVLRWIVELGRVDIAAESFMMASFMAAPRHGHLEQLFNILRT